MREPVSFERYTRRDESDHYGGDGLFFLGAFGVLLAVLAVVVGAIVVLWHLPVWLP